MGNGASGSRIESIRLGDIERVERKARARRESKKYLTRIAVACGAIALVVIGAIVLYLSPAFSIQSVEVTGSEHLTSSDMEGLVTIPQGTTLLNVDTDAISKDVLRDSWVQDVSIHRIFPSTLQIAITEREIAAVVEVAANEAQSIQPWAISSDGMWLMAIPDQDSELGQSISP